MSVTNNQINMKPNQTVIQLTIAGFVDSREVVRKLNEFYTATGVLVSQKAKYEKPTWYYIACILNGVNRKNGHTVEDIQYVLKAHGIDVSIQAIRRFLRMMMDTNSAVHPHRRNCGVSCHEIVTRLGGVESGLDSQHEKRGHPAMVYWFGAKQSAVNYVRRVFNLTLEP